MKKRDQNSERRNWARVDPSAVPFLKAVRFNYGKEVRVIDISQGGILVETEVRLQVQGKISLKVITGDGVIGLEGSVVRSSISSLTGGPKYKSAIAFEHPFTMLNTISQKSALPTSEPSLESPLSDLQDDPSPFQSLRGQLDENLSLMTFIAPETQVADLCERLRGA